MAAPAPWRLSAGDRPQWGDNKLNANAKPFTLPRPLAPSPPPPPPPPQQPPQPRVPPPTAVRRPQGPPPTTVGHRPRLRPPSPTQAPEEPTLITTPWYPEGVKKADITLSDEIERLSALLQLTPTEELERRAAVDVVAAAARRTWGEGVVTTAYGSFAAGTAAASSAVDVSVEHCGLLEAEAVGAAAAAAGTVRSALCEGAAAFAQVATPAGLLLNLSFASEAAPAPARAAEIARGWLAEFPPARTAHAVLRQLLSQTGNLDAASGGLSAHCLLAMIVACCRSCGCADATQLIINFCMQYGVAWDFSAASVDPTTGVAAPREHPGDILSVLDPVTPGGNLAAGCARLFAIRAQLQHCGTALLRWHLPDGACKGYKGKTPLSSVLSHQPLYLRLQQRAAAEAPPSPPAPQKRRYGRAELYALRARGAAPAEGLRKLSEIFVRAKPPSPDRSVFRQPTAGAPPPLRSPPPTCVPARTPSPPSDSVATLHHASSYDSLGYETESATPPRSAAPPRGEAIAPAHLGKPLIAIGSLFEAASICNELDQPPELCDDVDLSDEVFSTTVDGGDLWASRC